MNCRYLILLVSGMCSAALAQPEARFPVDMVWVAESLGDAKFAAVSRPTLRIGRDGQVSGSSGCNRYRGTAIINGASLSFGPLAMTRLACFGAGGDNERLFAPAIGSTSGWRMERRLLIIETAGGALHFRRR